MKKHSRRGLFFRAFFLSAFCLTCVFAFLLLAVAYDTPIGNLPDVSSTAPEAEAGEETSLTLAVISRESEPPLFFSLDFAPARTEAVAAYLPGRTLLYQNGSPTTLARLKDYGGAEYACRAAAAALGKGEGEYLVLREADLIEAIDRFGGVTAELPESVSIHRGGKTLYIGDGLRVLSGSELTALLFYHSLLTGEYHRRRITDLTVAALNSVAIPKNAELFRTALSEFLDRSQTGISATDYQKILRAAEPYFSSHRPVAFPRYLSGEDTPEGNFSLSPNALEQ